VLSFVAKVKGHHLVDDGRDLVVLVGYIIRSVLRARLQ